MIKRRNSFSSHQDFSSSSFSSFFEDEEDLDLIKLHHKHGTLLSLWRRQTISCSVRRLILLAFLVGSTCFVALLSSFAGFPATPKSSHSLRALAAVKDHENVPAVMHSDVEHPVVKAADDNKVLTTQSLRKCLYDGQCPAGSTCAVAPSSVSALGVCEPIVMASPPEDSIPPKDQVDLFDDACLQRCHAELALDEHYYHKSWPVIDWTQSMIVSEGRPDGCAVVFHREPEGNRYEKQEPPGVDNYETPMAEQWIEHSRFQHIIRVDPYSVDNLQDDRWMAYCFHPCQHDSDCRTSHDRETDPGFVCSVNGSCQRHTNFWDQPTQAEPHPTDLVVVTGVTRSYLRGVTNLAASLRYWAPHLKLVVYNLGDLTQDDMDTIRSWENVLSVEWADGVPAHYPPHIRAGKKYAWKPLILQETLLKHKTIFWLDGGSVVVGPLDPVEKILHRTGIVLFRGQDSDMTKSHPGMYEWFNTTKEELHTISHYSGNTQAYMYPSRYYDTVVEPNARCALDPNCIAPDGSGLHNHRYDQTSLSILAYMPKNRIPHHTEFLAGSRRQLASDRTLPTWRRVTWTARGGDSFYTQLDPQLFPYTPREEEEEQEQR